MKYKLLDVLICPLCKASPLKLSVLQENNREVIKGKIMCLKCGKEYQIINGIPCMTLKNDTEDTKSWDQEWANTDFITKKKHIENALGNKRVLLGYFSLAYLASKVNLKIKNSLEIGCGSGSYSLILKKERIVRESYLVDISLEALYLAKKIFSYFNEYPHLILADGRALPFKDKSFDLCLSGGLIEHFNGREQQKIVSEHSRVARKILVQVPLRCPVYWVFRSLFTIFHWGWPYKSETPLSYVRLKQLFSKEGYRIRETSYHDLLTATFFILSAKYDWIHPLQKKTFLNRLFKHEIVVYATPDKKVSY